MSHCLAKCVGVFSSEIKQVVNLWGKQFILVNKRSQEILKIQYRPYAESVIAMGHALVEYGIVKIKK